MTCEVISTYGSKGRICNQTYLDLNLLGAIARSLKVWTIGTTRGSKTRSFCPSPITLLLTPLPPPKNVIETRILVSQKSHGNEISLPQRSRKTKKGHSLPSSLRTFQRSLAWNTGGRNATQRGTKESEQTGLACIFPLVYYHYLTFYPTTFLNCCPFFIKCQGIWLFISEVPHVT